VAARSLACCGDAEERSCWAVDDEIERQVESVTKMLRSTRVIWIRLKASIETILFDGSTA
jgi:hypothetical protein